jgi:sarcosine oxidase subunit gamma
MTGAAPVGDVTTIPEPAAPLEGLIAPADSGILAGPLVAAIDLKGSADDPAFAAAVERVLSVPLPVLPNTTATAPGCTILWLGPDVWLVRADISEGPRLLSALDAALAGVDGAATDVSHAVQLITVAGPHARALLARGTPLDLHVTRFAAGACAQTRFAHAHVLIHVADSAPTFHVQVRRSHARYVWDYLAAVAPHAMAEQGASG